MLFGLKCPHWFKLLQLIPEQAQTTSSMIGCNVYQYIPLISYKMSRPGSNVPLRDLSYNLFNTNVSSSVKCNSSFHRTVVVTFPTGHRQQAVQNVRILCYLHNFINTFTLAQNLYYTIKKSTQQFRVLVYNVQVIAQLTRVFTHYYIVYFVISSPYVLQLL